MIRLPSYHPIVLLTLLISCSICLDSAHYLKFLKRALLPKEFQNKITHLPSVMRKNLFSEVKHKNLEGRFMNPTTQLMNLSGPPFLANIEKRGLLEIFPDIDEQSSTRDLNGSSSEENEVHALQIEDEESVFDDLKTSLSINESPNAELTFDDFEIEGTVDEVKPFKRILI